MKLNLQALMDQVTAIQTADAAFKTSMDGILAHAKDLLAQGQAAVDALIAANDAGDQAAVDAATATLKGVAEANAQMLTDIEANSQALVDAALANTPAAPATP